MVISFLLVGLFISTSSALEDEDPNSRWFQGQGHSELENNKLFFFTAWRCKFKTCQGIVCTGLHQG